MKTAAFLTSIPVEIVFAAGYKPVDLNNLFITSLDSSKYISQAEDIGFPRNYCAWIKGAFRVIQDLKPDVLISVGEGECTNNERMVELFVSSGLKVIDFNYPKSRQSALMRERLEFFMDDFCVEEAVVLKVKKRLDRIREKLFSLDMATYKDLNVSGEENYLRLITSSDFCGDYESFEADLDGFISELGSRDKGLYAEKKRIGLIGIPPITDGLFKFLEDVGGVVTYNEMPHQFAMPSFSKGLTQQYLDFSYAYGIDLRLRIIRDEIQRRKLDGIIHYVQSFCPRQLDDILLRNNLDIPILSLEGDRPGGLDERNKTRIEAFMERLLIG